MQEPVRVLIAEDDRDLRDAMRELLCTDPSIVVVGEAGDADEAIHVARATTPDVALLDVQMPGGGGPRATREICASLPETRIVALSGYDDRETVLEMLRAGAVSYLVKGAAIDDVIWTVHRAARGEGALSPKVAAGVIEALGGQLRKEEHELLARRERVERVQRVVDGEGLQIVFQPIMDLRDSTVVGLEALARFDVEPLRSPAVWFEEAKSVGLLADLELAAVRVALEAAHDLPEDLYVSVNLSPTTACDPRLAATLEGFALRRVVMEITEHAPIDDYDTLTAALLPFRSSGCRLAVDDAGAGFASFRHILRLSPDLIKLDIALTRDVDTDSARRALAAGLISFASEIHATIVAEGIETKTEWQTLGKLGVSYGQGYYLAPPAPFDGPSLSVRPRSIPA